MRGDDYKLGRESVAERTEEERKRKEKETFMRTIINLGA